MYTLKCDEQVFSKSFIFLISFFKYKFIYFHWRLITLQYCSGFVIHRHESATGVHVSPHPEAPPTAPSQPITLGCPRALGAPLQASNLYCSSLLPTVIYTFQCYSLKAFHPCLLPQSPKVCSLHLCLFVVLPIGLL